MQIGEEGGNNPDLVDMSAHGTRVLKNLVNVMLGISRKSSESKKESNELYLGDACLCGDLREPFPSQFGISQHHRAGARAKLQGRVTCPVG